MNRLATLLGVFLLSAAILLGQTVSSSVLGTVTDPAGAAIPAAEVRLADAKTGAIRTFMTDSSGLFRFPNVPPSTYSLTVRAKGFKTRVERTILVAASETRDLGQTPLEIGAMTETIAVTAEATPIQVASSEKAQTITGQQLNDITLKGRDLFGFMKLVPGVIDTANRDVTSPNGLSNITINGNTSAKNFTVDGITDVDTGSNGTIHYEPNLDAVQELRVLTSNYQAEFGRNSGGTITVVTKSGTQSFHGTAAWNHRHEGFNANLWANNRNGRNASGAPVSPISPYRYNVETYSIGGPVFIPKKFNTEKKKLFFFWSQEYTGQFVPGGVQNRYTPTLAERSGDFSQSRQNNGSLIVINDPATGAPFPGNVIPANRIDKTGQAMLNYFPAPNFVGTGSQANIVNYFEAASSPHPRRNDVLRIDTYLTSKLTGYFRYINDHDDLISLYQGVQFTRGTGGTLGDAGISPIDHPNPGHGYAASATWTITPTMVNEVTVGKSWNTWSWYSLDNFKSTDRSLVNNPAVLFPLPTGAPSGASSTNGYHNLMPQMSFGSPPSNSMSFTRNSTSAGAYENFNTIWSYQDNLSKVIGRHTIKTGAYLEFNRKIQPSGGGYSGNYSFAPDTNNGVNNTGNGYANALLGYVNSYSQQTARAVFNTTYWNLEMYVQDNWRVNRKLTLDFGIRLYHQTPQVDINNTFADFVPSLYSKTVVPRLYVPGTANGRRVAIDPGTNTVAPVAYIGLFVPNTGDPATGYRLLGASGNPLEPYTQKAIAPAARFGFAYDLNGDGKTAIRGGFGMFYNRLDGNQVYNMSGQPPYAYTPQVNYTTFQQIASTGSNLVFGPLGTTNTWPVDTQVPWDRVHNASLEVQREVGRGTVVSLGYVGNWGYNQNLTANINPIPIGTRAPFNPKNADPTNGNRTLPDIFLRSVYPAVNTINSHMLVGHTNYHAMQATLQRRLSRGLAGGLSYTWSRAMGTTSFTPVVPDNEQWNYGRTAADRRHNLQVNFSYNLPNLGQHLNSRILGAFTDRWTMSGIFSAMSGAPISPSFSINGSTIDYTGTPDVSARLNVVGDPTANVPAGMYFNPAAFAPPAIGTTVTTPVLGNMGGGAGVMSLPRITNLDVTMAKFIPLMGESRGLRLQVQAYNAFNHPEFNGVGTGLQFDARGVQNSLTAGVFNSTLPARILAFSARFEF